MLCALAMWTAELYLSFGKISVIKLVIVCSISLLINNKLPSMIDKWI